jgi:hypothetical protein
MLDGFVVEMPELPLLFGSSGPGVEFANSRWCGRRGRPGGKIFESKQGEAGMSVRTSQLGGEW